MTVKKIKVQKLILLSIQVLCASNIFMQPKAFAEGFSSQENQRFKTIHSFNKRFQCEPHVNEVIEKALFHSTIDPKEVEGLVTRARHRGWIPSLRFGVRRGQGNDQTAQYLEEEDRSNFSIDNTLVFDGTLTFDFARVLFAREEISFFREKKNLKSLRVKLIESVASMYYERRRLQIESILTEKQNLKSQIRIWEIEAFLDSATKQEFSSSWRCANKKSQ